jgi:hypothetical protein
MPRTFSRGSPFTSIKLFDFFDYLSVREAEFFVEEARVRFCPEPPLEEQDIMEIIDNLMDIDRLLRGLLSHNIQTHSSQIEANGTFVFLHNDGYINPAVKILTPLITRLRNTLVAIA